MTILLISCLSLLALPMMVDAKRVSGKNDLEIGDDMQAIANTSRDEVVVKPLSKFSFQIKKTLCAELDFGNMKSIVEEHPKAVKNMKAQALMWANEFNCRLCDLEGNEFTMGTILNTVEVKCHAHSGDMRDNLESACLAGNGKPGWRAKEIPPTVCLPCPLECESCEKAGASDTTYLNYKWFKCILPSANHTPVPSPWKCETIKERRNHPGHFQWCQYRKDLTKTSTNALEPEPSSNWQVTHSAVRCDKTTYEGNEHISEMVQALTPKLKKLASENCELCRVTVGGSVASDLAKEKEIMLGESSSNAWVDAKCAYDTLKSLACRPDRGATGWAPVHKCHPCPLECSSCEDRTAMIGNKRKFKCNLRFADGAGDVMAGMMFGKNANTILPKLPEGYECEKPTKKKCQTGGGVCIGGYKTHCKYATFHSSW